MGSTKSRNNRLSATRAIMSAMLVVAAALAIGSPSALGRPLDQGSGTGHGKAGQSGPARPMAPVGTAFTYQGQLKDGAAPANGSYDFQFALYDDAAAGNQVGPTLHMAGQAVVDGLFTVPLDFGAGAMQGDARWLEIAVAPAGNPTYTTLSPRQPLTAAPYAMSLVPGSSTTGSIPGSAAFKATNTGQGDGLYGYSSGLETAGVYGTSSGSGYGVHGHSDTTYGGVYGDSSAINGTGVVGVANDGTGILGTSTNGTGVTGFAGLKGVYGLASGNNAIGVHGVSNNGFEAAGVRGESTDGYGVRGLSTTGFGMYGLSTSSYGVIGESNSGWGVYGISSNSYGVSGRGTIGVHGISTGSYGVVGQGPAGGVYGASTDGWGVYGVTTLDNLSGVLGENDSSVGGYGVQGRSTTNFAAVYGLSWGGNGTGVIGVANTGANAAGVRGSSSSGWAGWFDGNVNVTGTCCLAAEGTYRIDHPTDPANKYLYQAAVESPDMVNIYSGNVTTGPAGEAVIVLPSYVEALDKDFRYQLTVMGQFAQAIVASKIKNGTFSIKTDKPNVEVSWQVTGVRKDPYAQAHPLQAEVDKPTGEKGTYLHPELYGQPESKGINYDYLQRLKQQPAKPGTQKP